MVDFFDKNKGTVTLCGSTKFFHQCLALNRLLTFKGWVVLMCGSWGHSYHKGLDGEKTQAEFEMVKKLHYVKILMSQAVVLVSDESMYYGDSTRAELEFARKKHIPVFYFDGKELTLSESSEERTLFNTLKPYELILSEYQGDLGF